MKKNRKLLLVICMVTVLACSCKDKEGSEEHINYISDDLPTAGRSYGEEDTEKIKDEITHWAQDYLLVDSDTSDEDKRIIKNVLEQTIVSDKDRKKVQEDWKKFYQEGDVKIGLVEAEVKSAYKVEYENQEFGRVDCKVKIYGTRNRERFRRNYEMKLIINHGEPTGIKEIESISW